MSDDEYLLMRRLQRSGSYEEAMAMMWAAGEAPLNHAPLSRPPVSDDWSNTPPQPSSRALEEELLRMRQRAAGDAPLYPRRPPEVKVTEVVGAYCDDPDSSWVGPVSLFGLMPRQALEPLTEMGCQRAGPRGRFRITVEFLPDE